jgi:hypothetical protein
MNFSRQPEACGTTGAPSIRNAVLIDGLRARAKQLLEEEFGAAELFVLKDPRICRIAPFWLEARREANIAPLVVIPVRSPLEVARSLASRDGFSLEKGLLLWLRHILDGERETHGLPRAIVTMEQFLGDWRGSIKTIATRLAIEWPSFDDAAADGVDSFLSPDLKHQNAPDNSLPPIYAWASDAYYAMLALRDNPKSRLARMALELACALMGWVFVEITTRLAQVEAEAAAIRAERDELIRSRDELSKRLKRAESAARRALRPRRRTAAGRSESRKQPGPAQARQHPNLLWFSKISLAGVSQTTIAFPCCVVATDREFKTLTPVT